MQRNSILSLNANHTMLFKEARTDLSRYSFVSARNRFSTAVSILRDEIVRMACMHSPAYATLSENMSVATFSNDCSIRSRITPAPKINGSPPKTTTRPSFQPTANARATVLTMATATVPRTPKLSPTNAVRASGSADSRTTRLSAEFSLRSKKPIFCWIMLLK